MSLHRSYKDMTDKDIVDLVIEGTEEAMLYLLYDRYEKDLRSTFRTWLNSVISHLFSKKRIELIGLGGEEESIEGNNVIYISSEHPMESSNQKLVILMEAINRLKNDDYRFILIKELEGYSHKEIAEMLIIKRKEENKRTFYKGKEVVPDATYVDMNKARALKEVKAIVEQIKKEWYENK